VEARIAIESWRRHYNANGLRAREDQLMQRAERRFA
jgi:hypothetical protein